MKNAVIGGAGVRTEIFINGLLKRYKKLHIDEVVLYDIQEEKQRIIEKLCKHVVERNHEELKVWAVSATLAGKYHHQKSKSHDSIQPGQIL